MTPDLALALDPTVQAAGVVAFGSIIVALLGLLAEGMRRNHNALRAVKKDTRGTREQVENSHSTNLRDDIDTLTGLVERVADRTERLVEGQVALKADVHQLRNEQHQSRVDAAQERQERLAADDRMDEHISIVRAKEDELARALRLRERALDNNPRHNI